MWYLLQQQISKQHSHNSQNDASYWKRWFNNHKQAQDVGDGSFIEPNVTIIFKCPCLFVVIEPPFPITCIVLGVLWMLLRSLLLQKISHVDWLSSSIMRQRLLVDWAWVLNAKEYCDAHTLLLPDSSSVLSFMLANWTDLFFERFFPSLTCFRQSCCLYHLCHHC